MDGSNAAKCPDRERWNSIGSNASDREKPFADTGYGDRCYPDLELR